MLVGAIPRMGKTFAVRLIVERESGNNRTADVAAGRAAPTSQGPASAPGAGGGTR